MKRVINFLLQIIDVEAAIEIILNYLETKAQKTNTKLDDKLVALLRDYAKKIKED